MFKMSACGFGSRKCTSMTVPPYEMATASQSYLKRIEGLFKRDLENPLLVISTPPGYGKSGLTEGFLQNGEYPYAILTIREIDNWGYFFWIRFIEAIVKLFPDLEEHICHCDFPDTPEKVFLFLKELYPHARAETRSVFVIDNYELLENESVIDFIKDLIECEIKNLVFAIIDNRNSPSIEALTRTGVSFARIGEDDLRLTAQEVRELFASYDMRLASIQAETLATQWEGWPLAICSTLIGSREEGWKDADPEVFIQRFFARTFFNSYAEQDRKVLVQLSLVDCFDKEMLRMLHPSSEHFITLLQRIPFICFDPKDETFSFRNAYRSFLAAKERKLDKAERYAAHKAAIDMLTAMNRPLHTLPYLLACENYDGITAVITESLDVYARRSKVRYLLHCIEELPLPYRFSHPRTEFLRIVFILLLGEIDQVEQALDNLFGRFDANEIDDRELLGEIHFLSAHVSHIRNKDDFVEHYRIASELLPNGSRYWSDHPPIILNAGLLMASGNDPDTLKRMHGLFEESLPYMKILLRGKGTRIALLYSATASFFTYHLEESYGYAQEIVYDAKLNGHHELLLVAYYILIRITMLKGSMKEARETLDAAAAHINKYGLIHLRGLYDRIAAYVSIYANREEIAPVWLTGDIYEGALWEYSREALAQACYLLEIKENRKAVALTNRLIVINEDLGNWGDSLYSHLYRAIARYKLDEFAGALDDLTIAYQMTYANNIITPFIECATGMRSLLTLARKMRPDTFDSSWMSTVYAKSSGYAKKIASYRNRLAQKTTRAPQLSPRKIDVLQALADGLTQKEIAQQLGVASSTVKTHITSIYETLGAQNKVDAVRIAISMGLIE